MPSKTGESVYKKVLKIRNMDYVADVPFIGIDTPSKYFDVNTDDLDGKVVISSALASRYDLKENSRFDVYDDVTGKEYTFTVASIVDYTPMEFARDFLVVILIYCLSTIVSLGQIRNVHELDYVRANE
ncbi:MAG: hypothetical protein K6E70_01980 [Butyrivibrio sp.]|nr:hypothetical protein [Butyrivibrio sp.]